MTSQPQRIPKAPDMAYLERAALYYLERFSASSAHFEFVLRRKIMRRCKLRDESPTPYYDLIPPLVARYQEAGLLDDERFTQAKVATLRRKGTSKRMIQAKLAQKGLSHELITQQIEQHETDELDAARIFAQRKKLGYATTPDEQKKELAKLARAGFSYEVCQIILKECHDA